MRFVGLGSEKSPLPFDMFDVQREADTARRADKLANIYHRGQELAWSGRRVLPELLRKHGGVQLDPVRREALGAVLEVLMWGELAAWKIAAQLSDVLVPLEAKLAATSQAHDEARHFYVMHDYMTELGHTPRPLDRPTRLLLDTALLATDPCMKIHGMQLLIESMALTLFQALRESRVEPVLCELLPYYEKDEARHVGLGLQFLPDEMRRLTRTRRMRLVAFQVELLLAALTELRELEAPLRVLGIESRQVFLLGTAKMALAIEMLWREQGGARKGDHHPYVARFLSAVGELFFPIAQPPGTGRLPRARAAAAAALRALRHGHGSEVPASSLDPEAEAVRATSLWSR
jgi:hypothetical protein